MLEIPALRDYLNVRGPELILNEEVSQDRLYEQTVEGYGSALDRLARAYEYDSEARRDLLQEIHLQLWLSFANFDQRCSLRTWVYRVAHNVATSHVVRQSRIRKKLVSIEELENEPGDSQAELAVDEAHTLDRLSALIRRLKPLDRQIILSYLEGMDANSIAEITGLSAANVAMKVHRIKDTLKRWFHKGGLHAK